MRERQDSTFKPLQVAIAIQLPACNMHSSVLSKMMIKSRKGRGGNQAFSSRLSVAGGNAPGLNHSIPPVESVTGGGV
jgi:hypothetical protein